MDVPPEILEELKCHKCEMYLSRGPVYLEHSGAAACGRCFSPKRPATRNKEYEAVAKLLHFHCKNRDLGCGETVGFEEVAHEARCSYRQETVVQGQQQEAVAVEEPEPVAVERQEECSRCEAEVTVKLYREEDGWQCERCAPTREACENQDQGCTHQDIPRKLDKHEAYFCQQSTMCLICLKVVSRGTLSTHYTSSHVTHGAGSTWRATRTGELGRRCLVTCPAGTAMCRYWLNDSWFELLVLIPVPSERLCEFRCEIRVTQPSTGLTHIYTPDVTYRSTCDWRIHIKKDFPSWTCKFDISVNICKLRNN